MQISKIKKIIEVIKRWDSSGSKYHGLYHDRCLIILDSVDAESEILTLYVLLCFQILSDPRFLLIFP